MSYMQETFESTPRDGNLEDNDKERLIFASVVPGWWRASSILFPRHALE